MKLHITTKHTQRIRNGLLALLFIATQVITTLSVIPKVYAAGVDFDQWANSTPASWQNGNLNENNSAYKEGESVPFRAIITGLSTGEHTLDIEYDNVDNGKHAYDYLTSFDRSESPNPCSGLSIICDAGTTGAIPVDSTLPSSIQQAAGQIKIFGNSADITSVVYLNTPGHNVASAKKTSLRISFTTNDPTAVIAWGGHIAKESDWGIGMGASGIPGSPYHQRILALDGSGGNQDRSLKASAVILLPRITITKVVQVGSALPSDFSFSVTPSIGGQSAYTIPSGKDSITIYDVANGNYTITESAVSGYGFVSGTGTNCEFVGSTATAIVAQGTAGAVKNASCTFTNSQMPSSITIIKDAIPNNGQDFAFTTTGTGLSNFSLDDDSTSTPLSNIKTFSNLLPGTYSISETSTTGWDLFDINCHAAQGVTINGQTISVELAAGQNISCTYTNKKRGTITVNKITLPANDPTEFSINASGTGSIAGDATRTLSTAQSVIYDVAQGTYSISEGLDNTPGWALKENGCTTITVNTTNLNPSCTITNTKLAKLKIVKDAVPNNGQDFGFTTSGTGLDAFSLDDDADATLSNEKQFVDLMPGAYSVTEGSVLDGQGKPLWDLTGLTCTGTAAYSPLSSTLNVTLAAGDDVTCTFTNTQRGSISGTKYEANADGSTVGTSGLSGWTINLLLNGNIVATETTDASGDYAFNNLVPGSEYTVEEVLQNGWTQIYDPLGITLSAGENETDQDFGNFQNGTISGYKWNDINGNSTDNAEPRLSGWTIYIDADNSGTLNTGDPSTITDAQGAYSFSNLAPNIAPGTQYKVCEVQQAGWVQTYPANDSCHTAIINISGETETRNFGNQGRGTIQVIKNVDTDGDGDIDTSGATDWTWDINGNGNYATGSSQNVPAGSYTVSEDQKANYHVTYSSCSGEPNSIVNTSLSATVTPGENVVCTFVNTRDTGTITVIKQVVADNGSTATPADFTMHVTASDTDIAGSPVAGSTQGTTFTVPTGTYGVHETAGAGIDLTDYFTTITCDWNKTRGGSAEGVTSQSDLYVATNDVVTCIFSNDDIAPQLTVIKQVINDNSGTSAPADFTMQVTGTNVAPSASFPGNSNGKTVTVNAGSYSLSESGPTGYTASYSTDCSGTIALAETKTCTIINDDIPHPGIRVEKTGPTTAYEGDVVTYTFTVTNTGDIALANVVVNDDLAGNAAYQSGDTNNDGKLDRTETWIFAKNYTIPSPQVANVVNTATVCATDPADTKVCDDDNHELDVLHPTISVIKYGPGLAYEGQTIGYTFLVTNTGDTTLYNVSISDDIAGSESCPKSTLVPQESMTCSAIYLIPIPTLNNVTNIVAASGTDSLSKTVTDTDDHTLDVLHPGIHIAKSGPTTAHEGDVVTYTFLVSNVGDIALGDISVIDDVAGTATYQSGDTNDNDLLDLTEIWTFTVNYTIPTPQVANIINTATACGDDPQRNEYCDNDSHELDVLHPSITVVKSGQATAYEGETVNYSFVVTNTGDVVLSNVGISDDIAVNELCPKTTLQPLESMTCIADYAIPTPQTADVINNVTTSGTDTLGQAVTGTDSHTLDVLHPAITVVKQVISTPEDDGLFNLHIDSTIHASNVSNKGSTGSVAVAPGSHTIGETAGTNTDLSDYAISYSDNCANGLVTVTGDDHQVCTITNTKLAKLTVVKDANPSGDQSFEFTVRPIDSEYASLASALSEVISAPTDNTFALDDNTDETLSDRKTINQLELGSYAITEEPVDGWDLTGITCDQDSIFERDGSTAIVRLTAGSDITCTFTNTQRGNITILKDAQPDSSQVFKFTANVNEEPEAFSLVDDGQYPALATRQFSDLRPGVYEFSEEAIEGWSLSDISCSNSNQDDVLTTANSVSVNLQPGDNIVCTFTNTRDTGTITVTKKLTPATDTGKFNLLINGTVYAANVNDGGKTDAVTVPTGVHTVSESAGLGTILEGYETTYVCMDNDSIITSGAGTTITALALAKGQNITCTFTNNIGEVLSIVTPPAPAPELADTGSAIILALTAGTLLAATTGALAFATRRYADQ